jgi:hypothetical protein
MVRCRRLFALDGAAKKIGAEALLAWKGLGCDEMGCGYAKQETEFHLDAPAAKVCDWIEHHPADLERAAGAAVLAERDVYAKLDQSDAHGQNVFWVKRSAQRGHYRETLTESVIGAMSREQTDVLVVPNESGGCDVTIQMTATVDGEANMKIAVASRRAIRGMRGLVERTFGQRD